MKIYSSAHNGSALSVSERVVVVTINYRLGPLGFLVHPDITARGKGNGGMNGIRDQITALQWISRNIHAFGGDQDRVTLFGVSAGRCCC